MLTEDFVSFETAELLKEKGMNKSCFKHYVQKNNNDGTSEAVTVCTLQMACKWLREVHSLFITIYPNYGTEKIAWSINQRDYDMNWVTIKHNYADYYEEACEAAIQYCLENLI